MRSDLLAVKEVNKHQISMSDEKLVLEVQRSKASVERQLAAALEREKEQALDVD